MTLQAETVGQGVSLAVPATRRWTRGEPRPESVFLLLVFFYLFLQSAAFAFESGLAKLASALFAFWMVAVMGVNALFLSLGKRTGRTPALGGSFVFAMLVYGIGLLGTVYFARDSNDLSDWTKLLLAPLFLSIGYAVYGIERESPLSRPLNRMLFACLLLLPLMVWALQLATGRTQLGGGQLVGVFVNRNNAGLYGLVLIGLYAVMQRRVPTQPLVYLAVGMAFGTLGLLAAVMLAVLIGIGGVRHVKPLLLAAVTVVVMAFVLPEGLILARLRPVFDTVALVMNGRINLFTVTYAELVQLLGTQDLSFVFRLKHWLDLAQVFVAGSPTQWLFGFGVGASTQLSEMRLVPHNDYVRLLFECGVFAFGGFVVLLGRALFSIGRGWVAVAPLGVAVYFFSENLLNNFLAMAVFFYATGALLAMRRQGAVA